MTKITSWSEIDWLLVNKNVVNLRRRIFDASVKNEYRKLRSLQRMMLKSKSNILYSIQCISNNSGSKTFGVDGEILDGPKDKLKYFYEISENGYLGREPSPTRRIYIKESNKFRPIGIPTVYDRIVQTMVLNSIEPEWEAKFEKGSYGFRPGRNVDDAINRLWLALHKPGSRKWIVDTDISKCFDSISHSYIVEKIGKFPAAELINKWLKAGIIIRSTWLDSGEYGTPQGSALSPFLCNLALHGLESELGVEYDNRGYVKSRGRLLIRFADDLVIRCHTKQDAILALKILSEVLVKRGLEISLAKTKIVHILDGFDFLGYTIRLKPQLYISYKECVSAERKDEPRVNQHLMGLYVNPSWKSIKKVKAKLKDIFDSNASNKTRFVIKKANEVIRGYAQSKWHWHSGTTYSHLNFYLYRLCFKWACKRHLRNQ